jgi:uncharacterized protein (UPF0332 family)
MKEEKLQIVEPSEEITNSYIKKSESNIISAKILLENDKLEEGVALTYYSMYHMLTALLRKIGIKCENHGASIILMKELFELDNSDISYAKSERVDKQYYTDFSITKIEVVEDMRKAELFNSMLLDFISKLNNVNINKYREKFMGLV